MTFLAVLIITDIGEKKDTSGDGDSNPRSASPLAHQPRHVTNSPNAGSSMLLLSEVYKGGATYVLIA